MHTLRVKEKQNQRLFLLVTCWKKTIERSKNVITRQKVSRWKYVPAITYEQGLMVLEMLLILNVVLHLSNLHHSKLVGN